MNKNTNGELSKSNDINAELGLLTIKDVATMLKISVTSARRLQQGRRIPFIKVGGSIRFVKEDVIEFLKKNRIEVIG